LTTHTSPNHGCRPLNLLLRYLEIFHGEGFAVAPELHGPAVAHVYDLLALALAPANEAREAARREGVRAARLQKIKQDIAGDLSRALDMSEMAARHRLTPRSVQMLFESEGTTFTDFVREQRLARAHRMLTSGRIGSGTIADIALACGFGDISYFNRKFRARYGTTPSDARNRSGK
jgi:transcriptional regulator GlxA family with amidase domain